MGRRASLAGVVGACAFAAVALAAQGQLDGGFGSGGQIRTDLGGADWAAAVALARDGDVVVAGGSDGDVAVVRYDRAGRLDPTLGGDGTVVTDLGADDGANALVVEAGGSIVVAGRRGPDLALVRYSRDGKLDPSFGHGGIVVTDLGGDERAFALLRRPGGRLLVAGRSSDGLVLARYLRDGRLDPAFGRRGTVTTRTQGLEWGAAAPGPNGTIVVAAERVRTRPPQGMALAVARYRADGRLDRTFARHGLKVTITHPHWAGALHVAVRPDGRIVLGTHGHAGADAGGFALMQLRRDGSLDPTFGERGIAVSYVGFGVHALALDRRGRIVTVGRTRSLRDFVAARFLADGRLDRSFANTVADFGGIDVPFEVALQPDGKIVAAGASGETTLIGDIVVARYLASR